MANTNKPMVLVEFTPEEITWMADRLHEEWARTLTAGAIVTDPAKREMIEKHQKMQNELRNRILANAAKQGFGDL